MRIGIPRALLYYAYQPFWAAFFTDLGHEVVVSCETTKATLDHGVRLAVEETCLPVKIFYGHCAELLAGAVDTVFVPRLVSVEPKSFICPKFMGLPDMIRHAIPERGRVLEVTVDMRRHPTRRLWQAAVALGRSLGAGEWRTARALARATHALRRFELGLVEEVTRPAATVGLLGHPYNIHDAFLNMNLRKHVAEGGFRVVTPETVPGHVVAARAGVLPKALFWTYGRRVYGAAEEWLATRGVAGLVHIVSFGCGPDSLVGELVQRRAKVLGDVPFLLLTLDEHTGAAGVLTRLEAFLDMVVHRRNAVGQEGSHGA